MSVSGYNILSVPAGMTFRNRFLPCLKRGINNRADFRFFHVLVSDLMSGSGAVSGSSSGLRTIQAFEVFFDES